MGRFLKVISLCQTLELLTGKYLKLFDLNGNVFTEN